MKFLISLSLALIVATLAVGFASAETESKLPDQEPFHIANSDAEKALLDIIRRAIKDDNIIKYVLGTFRLEETKDNIYSRLFTKNFLRAAAKKESDLVKRSCDGEYRIDEICGIDYNPISCAQDFIDEGYLFRTKEDNGHKATINFLWTPFIDKGRRFYRLIKDGDHWKLDGVDCGNGAKFNMD